jgi:hypothetical protein
MHWPGRLLRVLTISFVLAVIPSNLAFASPSTALAADQTLIDYPTDMPAIAVSVIRDGLDAHGHWTQTVRLTIRPGGTLADASLVAFGDLNHVDDLFRAAQRSNPHLVNPAMIPIGQNIDLQIDPATAFVLETVLHGSNTIVQRFSNGVVETTYQSPNGSVKRMLTFPDRKPTDYFAFPATPSPIKVRPGGRIVDLQFARGESFAQVVQQTYGITTYSAAVDLTHQTGWDPTHWPPPTGDVKRVVTEPTGVYQIQPAEVAPIPNPNPIGRARQTALHAERRRAGIYAVRQESFATVYHVAVTDPNVTASELSYLIYGSTAHRLEIARAAGYQIPNSASNQPTPFDPHLLGRAFDLAVNYQDEHFVAWRTVDSRGVEQVGLVDGAEITSYPLSSHGLQGMVKYPTQYKLIVYRPSKISLVVAQGLGLFHVASNMNLSSETANALAREYAAQVIWQWSPGMPRSPGDIPDSIQLVDEPGGTVVRVLVGPPAPRTVVGDLADRLDLQNPLVAAVGLVMIAAVVFLAVDLGRRYTHRHRSLRW